MRKLIFAAAVLATGAAHAETLTECDYARPFKVLNAETGQYQVVQTKVDRGWCSFSGTGIDNAVFAPEGPGAIVEGESAEGTCGSPK